MIKPAVFLDRDGVLTKEKGYIASVEALELFPYAAECIRRIQEKNYYAIVITNQSGVARGLFTEQKLLEMNRYLMLKTNIDAVYYCPHHPKDRCSCRKPKTGMFEEACRKFGIDLKHSYMVGDRASDITAGQNAGVKTILLESGYGTAKLEAGVKPDFIAGDLRDAVAVLA